MPRPDASGRPRGKDLFEQIQTSKMERAPLWISLYGPRGDGKTTAALTLSKAFQELKTTPGDRIGAVEKGEFEPFHVDDVGFVFADQDGDASAVDFGCTLEYGLDFNKVLTLGYGAEEAMLMTLDAAFEGFPESVDWLVIDTVTTFDSVLLAQSQDRAGDDTRSSFNYQLQAHRNVVAKIKNRWNKNVCFLFHPKALKEATSADEKKTRKATWGTPPDIVASVTGKGGDLYLNPSSLIGVLLKRRLGNKFVRRLFSGNDLGYEGKSRFESVIKQLGSGKQNDGIVPDLGLLLNMYQEQRVRKV